MDTSIEVIVDNVENNPHCFHGPSLLFKRFRGKTKEYYACSACRDHKDCNFFIPLNSKSSKADFSKHWKDQQKLALSVINKSKHYKKYLELIKSLEVPSASHGNNHVNNDQNAKSKANYCQTCNCLFQDTDKGHFDCKVIPYLTHYQLTHPTEILIPKVDSKTHAQYFFSKTSVEDIVLLLTRLKVSKVVCIGTPRIHEYVLNEQKVKIKSLLLDLDRSYYNFYSKNEFIWYNMFNNYIFDAKQQQVLHKFLYSGKVVVLLDPPFGGRVEPLAQTLNMLSQTYVDVNKCDNNKSRRAHTLEIFSDVSPAIPAAGKISNVYTRRSSKPMVDTFWFFPYFMEQHIVGSLPNFNMFDYKVNYENHSSFTNEGNKKRKFGSPVRIFTNVPLSHLDLKGVSGYKFCKFCDRWVSNENKHCDKCSTCTSKNGKTYVHCSKCSKCVKPSYEHCDTCLRCCLPTHVCGEFQPDTRCFHCHQSGHKKKECPRLADRKKKGSFACSPVLKKKRKIK